MKKNNNCKQIKFGLVGHGLIGSRYVEKISENPLAKLVAVADQKKERLTLITQKNIKKYTDYHDLLKNSEVDVVVVAVPNYLHKQVAVEALNHDKHVLCEKPMCLSVADANEMILTAQKTNKQLIVVKQNRFNPPVKKVKELIQTGQLGKIGLVAVNCFWNRNDQYYTTSDWKGKKALDGGTLYTQFSHFIDIVYYLCGDFTSVYAHGINFKHLHNTEFEDTGTINFKLASGAVGTINFSTCAYEQNMEGSISIISSLGSLKIGGQYLNTFDYYKIKGIDKIEIEAGNSANNYGFYQGSMSNHDKVITNVVNTLNGKEIGFVSGFEAMKIVQVIEAMYESMETNLPVKIR